MRVVMIGAGYVGLTTGACLAHIGNHVTCVDKDERRVAALKAGKLPIFEPGLQDLFEQGIAAGRLEFDSDIGRAVADAELVFLTVGTPSGASGSIDLSQLRAAAADVAPAVGSGAVVVVKSSVTAGTARSLGAFIDEKRGKSDVATGSNPEFLREGTAVADFTNPDRIVIGADDPRAAQRLSTLYAPFRKRGVRFIDTTTVNAEMIKYASNAFLAMKIGFINEIADFCEAVGGDIEDVATGIGSDSRIGPAFLAPGPGYGGSCLPKDTRAFAHAARRQGAPQRLIEGAIRGNEKRKQAIAGRILREIGNGSAAGRVAVLGLAFKANTDDARESAALTIVPRLVEAGLEVAIHDPEADMSLYPQLAKAQRAASAYEAVMGAKAAVILTDWPEYAELDLARLRKLMAGRTLIDCRNLFEPQEAAQAGLRYLSIGRAPAGTGESTRREASEHGVHAPQAAAAPW